MATDATDKLLVASVLERGKRDMDGDIMPSESDDELGTPAFDAAAELGVQVSVDERPEAGLAGAAGQARGGRRRQALDARPSSMPWPRTWSASTTPSACTSRRSARCRS